MDRIIAWRLADYITLEDPSRERMRDLLDQRLSWHCAIELPQYVSWLEQVGGSVASREFTVYRLRQFSDQIEVRWSALMQPVASDVAAVLAEASTAEIQSLYRKLAERHRENWDRYVRPEASERVLRRAGRMEDRATQWLGTLNPEQQEAIGAWSEKLVNRPELWLSYRSQWQSRLRASIEANRGDAQGLTRALEPLLAHPRTLWTPEYRAVVETNTRLTLELLAQLLESASDSQLRRVERRVASIADDLTRSQC